MNNNNFSINFETLTGRSEEHINLLADENIKLHKDVVKDFLALKNAAKANGFELGIVSAFRNFERQLLIFNHKAEGLRPVVDESGKQIDKDDCTEKDWLYAILRYSALPGGSRHHFGTEFDVYDAKRARDINYEVQLLPAEYDDPKIFGKFYNWLAKNQNEFGFFNPYKEDKGGVAREPWHISHYHVANNFAQKYTFEIFKKNINESPLELKEIITSNIEDIFHRFVRPHAISE